MNTHSGSSANSSWREPFWEQMRTDAAILLLELAQDTPGARIEFNVDGERLGELRALSTPNVAMYFRPKNCSKDTVLAVCLGTEKDTFQLYLGDPSDEGHAEVLEHTTILRWGGTLRDSLAPDGYPLANALLTTMELLRKKRGKSRPDDLVDHIGGLLD